MKTDTTHENFSKVLSQRFLEAWQIGHGGNPDEAHILIGDKSIALTIPGAMVKAEIALFNKSSNTRMLDQYLRSVLEMVAEGQRSLIEDYFGREIKQVTPLIDLKAGWITVFYRFNDKTEDQND
jgi:uncharacterized protein YbcI